MTMNQRNAMPSVLGFGGYVPDRIVTNADWEAELDTTDEWITQRTGIKTRRFAAPEETTMTMSAAAARVALADADLVPTDLDEIIIATDTPEARTPDTAAFLQFELGCREIPGYDLGGSGCAGFVQALDVARARIHLEPKRVLVVGVELITRMINLKDRATAVLFGDAAGAVILGPPSANGVPKLLNALAGTDGSKTGILTLTAGGTRLPFTQQLLDAGEHEHLVMEGQEVFRNAVARMVESIEQILVRVDKTLDDVAMVIPHQANKRIIDAVRRKMHIDEDKVYVNVQEYGNTGSASVPLALWEAQSAGIIKSGDLVILTAFGAGFHWAAAALQF